MNRREKIILAVVGSFVGLGVLYLIVNSLLLAQAGDLESRIAGHRKKLADFTRANNQSRVFRRRFDDILARTHAGAVDVDGLTTQRLVSQRLRSWAVQSRLSERDFAAKAFSRGGPSDGRFKESGWNVHVVGRLPELTNFLYLVKSQPYLHRIDSLVAKPDLATGQVELSFKYVTPVLLPEKTKSRSQSKAKAATKPAVAPAEKPLPLNTPERRRYDGIASRDLFRPYIKKPPVVVRRPPPPKPQPRPSRPATPPPPPPTDPFFRIVGLSNWSADPAKATIVVLDTRNQQTVEHKIGDALLGGKIVSVDYRPMPSPDNADLLSPSRVIVKVRTSYYAVELGQTLDRKRRLASSDLPAGLMAQTKPVKKLTPPSRPQARPAAPRPVAPKPVKTVPPTPPKPAAKAAPSPQAQATARRAERLASLRREFRQRTLALREAFDSETNDSFVR